MLIVKIVWCILIFQSEHVFDAEIPFRPFYVAKIPELKFLNRVQHV